MGREDAHPEHTARRSGALVMRLPQMHDVMDMMRTGFINVRHTTEDTETPQKHRGLPVGIALCLCVDSVSSVVSAEVYETAWSVMAQSPDLKYEDALKRLEKLVAELDKADLDLEARLKKFEEGTRLARVLLKKLDQAKKKVQMLVKTQVGEATLVPIEDEELDEGHTPTA